jgi:hypothetical protein
MKKKIIIGSSIILIIASVIMHFFLKDTLPDSNWDWLDFTIGAMFGAGITLPVLLLNDIVKD